jgi:hypothetical protein
MEYRTEHPGQGEIRIYTKGPAHETELNKLREQAADYAFVGPLTGEQIVAIEKFVADNRYVETGGLVTVVGAPDVNKAPVCRVGVVEGEIHEVYGRGTFKSSTLIYPVSEETRKTAHTFVNYPDAEMLIVDYINL